MLASAGRTSIPGETGGRIMKDLAGRLAVVTGGGSGMGRELVRQLVAEGCSIALCDVSTTGMADTKRLCEQERLPQGLRITTHVVDVADESQVKRFRDEVEKQHEMDRIHLLFNNAGIPGKVQAGNESDALTEKQLRQARARLTAAGVDAAKMSDAQVEQVVRERVRRFVEEAPMTAAQAATVILDGVKADRWRILVGEDARKIDERVRQMPEQAYDVEFFEKFAAEVGWKVAR